MQENSPRRRSGHTPLVGKPIDENGAIAFEPPRPSATDCVIGNAMALVATWDAGCPPFRLVEDIARLKEALNRYRAERDAPAIAHAQRGLDPGETVDDWIAGGHRPPGDRGRRYEVHSRPAFTGDGGKNLVGWHDTLVGARRMADAAVLHPKSTEAWVIDLADSQTQVYETRKPTR